MALSEEVKTILENLTYEEKQLILLCEELYDKKWDRFLIDLEERLKGRPYIFRLVNRIEEDIKRVKKLQAIEADYNISLFEHNELIQFRKN